MKKFFYILILFITIVSCSPMSWQTIGNGNTMRNDYMFIYDKCQFDSICFADSLPSDLELWLTVPIQDYETKKAINKYMYIKKNDSIDVIYLMLLEDDKYNFTKRITE